MKWFFPFWVFPYLFRKTNELGSEFLAQLHLNKFDVCTCTHAHCVSNRTVATCLLFHRSVRNIFSNMHKYREPSLVSIHVLHSSQNNRLFTNMHLLNPTTFHSPYAPNAFLSQPFTRNPYIVQNLHILFDNGSLHSIYPHFQIISSAPVHTSHIYSQNPLSTCTPHTLILFS